MLVAGNSGVNLPTIRYMNPTLVGKVTCTCQGKSKAVLVGVKLRQPKIKASRCIELNCLNWRWLNVPTEVQAVLLHRASDINLGILPLRWA